MKRDIDFINPVRQPDLTDEALRRRRLRTMQGVALGLLVAAALLFALARSRHGQHPAWGYLEAFAEAAMVGALADWFAVVALFRHPLGIPLWHTAIIPNSKEQIGSNLGTFVESHFITEEGIAGRIREADIAARAGAWLLVPANARQAGSAAADALGKVLRMTDGGQLRAIIRDFATAELARVDLSALAGGCIDALVQEGTPQQLLDAVLEQAAVWLGDPDNHGTLENFIVRSLAIENAMLKSAMKMYAPKAIGSLREQVVEIRMDPAHPLRERVGGWVAEAALRLKADPSWHATVARYQAQALGSEKAQAMLGGIWDTFRERLLADLNSGQPALATALQGLLEKTGRLLVDDAGVRDLVNGVAETGSVTLVRRYRGEAGKFIEQQLAQWTREEMSTRIELAIGRDLQFIRINGTLVGGLAGVLIHAITAFM